MQSTGHASTQAVSLVPIQGSAITYAICFFSPENLDFSTLILAQHPRAGAQCQKVCFAIWETRRKQGRKGQGNMKARSGSGLPSRSLAPQFPCSLAPSYPAFLIPVPYSLFPVFLFTFSLLLAYSRGVGIGSRSRPANIASNKPINSS